MAEQEEDIPLNVITKCSSDAELLLEYVKNNQTDSLKSLIKEKPDLLTTKLSNHSYSGEQILAIACSRKLKTVKENTVQELINLGADLYFNHNRALHVAVVNPNSGILQVLIRNKYNINALCKLENSALHTLVKHVRDCKKEGADIDEDTFVDHVKLLLSAGIDVNRRDDAGNKCTAIVLAANNGFKSIVNTLIDESKTKLNLDNCTYRGKTAREWINENKLYDLTEYDQRKLQVVEKYRKDVLFELIRIDGNEKEFIEMFQPDDNPDEDDGTKTFLQYSCDKNCLEIVKFLCEKKADPNKTVVQGAKTPLYLALNHGYYKIVKILGENHADVNVELVSIAIKCNDRAYKNEDINYEKCLEILVKSVHFNEKIIHEKDSYGNTPLNNTVMWGPSSLTETLLKNGANLGSRNHQGFMPIQFIDPKILKKHLDSCIETEVTDNLEENKIILKLDTLIPGEERRNEERTIDPLEVESQPLRELDFKREKVVIDLMAKSPKLRDLLKHPVIACFLMMKWHRIRFWFYVNLVFYAFFVVLLNIYIFMINNNNFNSDLKSTMVVDFRYRVYQTLWIALLLTSVLLWLRELFQFFVSPKKYLFNYENYIEISLLSLTSIILFDPSATNYLKKQLSAFAIVFSAIELVLMVGQHPIFTTYVMMFKTVSENFFKLFMYSLLLIIAFAFSFSVLFTKSITLESKTNSSSDGACCDKKDNNVTDGLAPWLFMSFMMLAGQLDASSLDFKIYPICSRIIFTIFVFIIIIILMNLLNGLAVSDTQTIKNDSELIGHIARAKFINHYETLIIEYVFKKHVISYYAIKLFRCCSGISWVKDHFRPKLCLFSTTPKNLFLSTRNTRRCLMLDDNNYCLVDEETFNWANIILHRKKTDVAADIEQLKAEQNIIMNKLDEVLCIMTTMSKKFENENH